MWFYGVGLLAPSTIPNVEDQGIHFFVWGVTFDFYGMGGPTSNYAKACIALRMIWLCKPHHYIQLGIPSGEFS